MFATFHFDHFNGEILKASLDVDAGSVPPATGETVRDAGAQGVAKVGLGPLWIGVVGPNDVAIVPRQIRCTNDRIAFDYASDGGAGRLSFRYACGDFPSVGQFHLLLYAIRRDPGRF